MCRTLTYTGDEQKVLEELPLWTKLSSQLVKKAINLTDSIWLSQKTKLVQDVSPQDKQPHLIMDQHSCEGVDSLEKLCENLLQCSINMIALNGKRVKPWIEHSNSVFIFSYSTAVKYLHVGSFFFWQIISIDSSFVRMKMIRKIDFPIFITVVASSLTEFSRMWM